eukprot:COSAG05_NODE_31_length_28416_cov_170.150652_17_plen_241_part_00
MSSAPAEHDSRPHDSETGEVAWDLWVGRIPNSHLSEAAITAEFKRFGAVQGCSLRKKQGRAETRPRSWAYVKFAGTAQDVRNAVLASRAAPIILDVEDSMYTLLVREAVKERMGDTALTIWNSVVAQGRAKLELNKNEMVSQTDGEAEKLLYEISFTALNSRYVDMEHHSLISMRTLDRLQEALKKGQDILVTMRGQDLDETNGDEDRIGDPIYHGTIWERRHSRHVLSLLFVAVLVFCV